MKTLEKTPVTSPKPDTEQRPPTYPGESIDRKRSGLKLHSYKYVQSHRAGRILAYWLVGISIIFIGALFLPWQQNIKAKGEVTALLPEERPQKVNAVIGGMIEAWYAREGEYVEKGDTLVRISEIKDKYFDPQTVDRLREQAEAKRSAMGFLHDKVAALNQQISAYREGQDFSLQKARNKLQQASYKVSIDSAAWVAAKLDNEVAQQRFQRYESLFNQGLLSLTDYESRKLKLQESAAKVTEARNKYDAALNERLNARIELSSIRAEYASKIAKAISDKNEATYKINDTRASVIKAENEARNIEIRNSHYYIRAPQTGLVVKATKTGIGETIKEGGELLSIMPEKHTLAVALYVTATDVPLIAPGRKVRLQFDGWPALQFSGWPSVSVGTFGGEVAVVDFVESKNNQYRVLVVEDPAEEPWPHQLRMGSGVYGWAMLDEVPLWFELWRQFNAFPPTLDEPPVDDFKPKSLKKRK